MSILMHSPSFKEGGTLPKKYTYLADNASPPLSWSSPPEGTKSLALVCEDPDAIIGTWIHWVVYGIPVHTLELPEGIPADSTILGTAKHGTSSFGSIGYGGPCPPPGPAHRYCFKLYALDSELDLEPGATHPDLINAIQGHILDEGQIIGMFGT